MKLLNRRKDSHLCGVSQKKHDRLDLLRGIEIAEVPPCKVWMCLHVALPGGQWNGSAGAQAHRNICLRRRVRTQPGNKHKNRNRLPKKLKCNALFNFYAMSEYLGENIDLNKHKISFIIVNVIAWWGNSAKKGNICVFCVIIKQMILIIRASI